MPIVRVEMYEGRSMDQKRELARDLTAIVARVTGNPADAVHVIIEEIKRENWAIGGVLQPDRQAQKR